MINEVKKETPAKVTEKPSAEPVAAPTVPVAAENKDKPVPAEKKDEVIENLNVLVIDDSKALRRVVVKFLQNKFYCNVYESDNGKDGLQLISEKKGKIDLILCDLMMPVMDGLTFIKTLKSNESLEKIPVVFLTAKNDKETVTKCAKAGANDFIIKPYDLATISKKIEKFLKVKI